MSRCANSLSFRMPNMKANWFSKHQKRHRWRILEAVEKGKLAAQKLRRHKVHLVRRFRSRRWTWGALDPSNSRLFKVDVPQAVEEIFVFNRSKKCFQHSGDFLSKMCIFWAAVVNKKYFSSVQKSHRWNQRERPRQRKNCAAIDKDRAAWSKRKW